MICPTGNIPYHTPATRARHTNAKSGRGGFAYQCRECGQWHTTRSQRTVGRPAQEVA